MNKTENELKRRITVLDAWQTFGQGVIATKGILEKQLKAKSIGGLWNDGYVAAMQDAIKSLDSLLSEMDSGESFTARRAVSEPEKDKARLDWLDQQEGGIDHQGYGEYAHYFGPKGHWNGNAREAIDNAMAGCREVE